VPEGEAIRQRLARNRGLIVFPWPLRLAVYVATLLPHALVDRLTRSLPRKL